MTRRREALVLVALSVFAVSRAAPAAGPAPIVRVYVAGPPEAVSGSRDAIQDLCSRSNVAVVVRDAAGADEALLATSQAHGLAQAYVDLRPGSAPRVVVVDGETHQDLERRTLPEDASLEISIETMAHVVCSAVESSIAARAAPPPLAAPAREPAPPPRPARWDSRANAFASAANFGAGFRVGAGAALGVSHGRSPARLGGFFSFSGFPSSDVSGAGGSASFSLLGIRALPTLEWQVSDAVIAFAGIGAGVDWLRISAQHPPPGAQSNAPSTSIDPMASGMLGVRVHLTDGLAALLAFDTDVDLRPHRYVISSPMGNQSFFDFGRVRPLALAGLSLALGSGDQSSELRP